MKAIPAKSSEVPLRSSQQPDQRSWLRRHKGVPAGLAGVMLIAAAAILNPFEGESSPTVGVHMTLADCDDGRRDTRPQHMGLYRGQKITMGLGDQTLNHTVTIEAGEGSRIQQTHVDEGVTLKVGDGPQPEPGQTPNGTTLVYALDNQAEVTITARPTTDPLVTEVAFIRSC